MKKTRLFGMLLLQLGISVTAQNVTEVTGLRFYEHHSSTINGGMNFGTGANGSQSGYDFVNHTYYNSFNTANFGAYLNGEEANIDMVEHNGPFGNGGGFGVTSGVSSIWVGDIQGNNSSLWVMASGSFDYDGATDVADLSNEYASGTASNEIASIQENGIYISKIRNSDLYVAMKCYNVNNVTGAPSGAQDVSFDFDYKYGTLSAVGIAEVTQNDITVYPNPATDIIHIDTPTEEPILFATVYALNGDIVLNEAFDHSNETLHISPLNTGIYMLKLVSKNGHTYLQKLVKK